jgi:hypothetical protein
MPRKNPHAVALGRRGGKVSSPAKTAAVRKNAKLGGRPTRFQPGDRVVVVKSKTAPAKRHGQVGTIEGPSETARSYYTVRFPDATLSMPSWWLKSA